MGIRLFNPHKKMEPADKVGLDVDEFIKALKANGTVFCPKKRHEHNDIINFEYTVEKNEEVGTGDFTVKVWLQHNWNPKIGDYTHIFLIHEQIFELRFMSCDGRLETFVEGTELFEAAEQAYKKLRSDTINWQNKEKQKAIKAINKDFKLKRLKKV